MIISRRLKCPAAEVLGDDLFSLQQGCSEAKNCRSLSALGPRVWGLDGWSYLATQSCTHFTCRPRTFTAAARCDIGQAWICEYA